MKVLVIGSGGREHALAWKVSQSPILSELFITPGNGGTHELGVQLDIKGDEQNDLLDLIQTKEIELVIIGPEQPLAAGLVDRIRKESPQTAVLGPSQAGAELESSKAYAKAFMHRHGVPTASYKVVSGRDVQEGHLHIDSMKSPIVLKADGLAAGKGVVICQSHDEAHTTLDAMLAGQFGDASRSVVIEAFLQGIEYSAFVLTDGTDFKILPYAKDYKRVGEGDQGLNTGGMGSVSPVPFIDDDLHQKTIDRIVRPTIEGLKKEQIDYRGILFIGLINVDGDPYVIEYNVRLGDPETQVILPRITTDWLQACHLTALGRTSEVTLEVSEQTCMSVILASGGYPSAYEKGKLINGLAQLDDKDDVWVFHAGTQRDDTNCRTIGGRVLAVVGQGPDLKTCQDRVYKAIEHIHFDRQYFRRDIGFDLLNWSTIHDS